MLKEQSILSDKSNQINSSLLLRDIRFNFFVFNKDIRQRHALIPKTCYSNVCLTQQHGKNEAEDSLLMTYDLH